jgi:uncharacterized protein (DUF983 family)
MARLGAARALVRGLTRRCPRCGQGKLFRRWVSMVERCPRCGLVLEREEGAFLGSLVLNYSVTALSLIAYLIVVLVLTLPHPPVFVLTAGAVVIAVTIPLIVYPFAKTTWAAIDLLLHPRSD